MRCACLLLVLLLLTAVGCGPVGRYQPVEREGRLYVVDTTNGWVYIPKFTGQPVGTPAK